MLRLEFAELRAGDHVGHGAPGAGVGHQHGLVRIQDRRGFGHEMHAAEHDDGGVDFGGLAGEFEGIAREVGDVLHVGHLVVVREDDGLAFDLEFLDFGDEVHASSL